MGNRQMGWQIFYAVFFATILFCSVRPGISQERRSGPSMDIKDHYMRGVYWPWERTGAVAEKAGIEFWVFVENTLKILKNDLNCNVVWFVNIGMEDAARVCDIAERYHIGVMPNINPFLSLSYHGIKGVEDIKNAAVQSFNILGGKRALTAYVLRDEPSKAIAKQMEVFRREMKAVDPSRESVVVTMHGYTESYALQTGFPVQCVDIYPFGGDRSPNIPNPALRSQGYYRNTLSALAGAVRKAGRHLWIMPGVFGDFWGPWWYDENMNVVIEPGTYHHWRMPTVEETRWQIWEGVRNGCRGVVFYVLWPAKNDWDGKGEVPEKMAKTAARVKGLKWPVVNKQVKTEMPEALMYINGVPTPQMREMGRTFGVISEIENLLMSLKDADFPAAFVEDTFTTATFISQADSTCRYVVVVNDNLKEAQQKKILFMPNIKRVEDVIAKKELAVREENSSSLAGSLLTLEAGGGTLLRLEFVDEKPGHILFDEDFSIATMGLQTKNVVRHPVKRAFNTGWEWIVQKEKDLSPDVRGTLILPNISRPGGATQGVLTTSKTEFDVYMQVKGNFKDAESLIVEWVGEDGKRGWLMSNNYHLPVDIPQGIKDVEIHILDGVAVNRILLWAIPKKGR